jgi:porphobilinogen synthase
MLAEVTVSANDLVAPLFVCQGEDVAREIPSMPGQFQFSTDRAMETVERWRSKGIRAVLLFGLPATKDETGSSAWDDGEVVQELCRRIKAAYPEMLVMTDVCLCEYTSHGHCGPLVTDAAEQVTVDNDAALALLAKVAVSHADAGADILAPSAMMDGQVATIRAALDGAGFADRAIMSYAVKFASSLYGPFRDAADSAPSMGDRRSYQMDFRAPRQATLEAIADEQEGADILMVKPAGAYLDVIQQVRQVSDLPLAAYQVSGEYAAIKAAGANGWLDELAVATEAITAIKRAGADLIITYFAEQMVDSLR